MIRVALIDDHALVRAGVRGELEESENSDVEVVAEAGTVADAIDAIVRSKPDVVVCDVHLPDGTAADVIAGVVERGVTSRFLALSVSDAATDVIHVIRSGARGYVTKAIEGQDLVNAVRRVNDGDAVFSPRLAGFVLDAFSAESRVTGQSRTRRADRPGAGGHATPGPRLRVQGDRPPPLDLDQDGGEPRVGGAAKTAAVEPQRVGGMGRQPQTRLIARRAAGPVFSRPGSGEPPSAAPVPRPWIS